MLIIATKPESTKPQELKSLRLSIKLNRFNDKRVHVLASARPPCTGAACAKKPAVAKRAAPVIFNRASFFKFVGQKVVQEIESDIFKCQK
jgi:hypothetical protein